jgi:hypothetical protein
VGVFNFVGYPIKHSAIYLHRIGYKIMWKQLTAAIFLLAFLAQTFSKAIIVMDFYANQKYIAQNLCVNRNNPKMHCCGKCQLCKRLNQEDNKDKQNPERKNENKDEVLSSKSFFATCNFTRFLSANLEYTSYQNGKITSRSFAVFHPPCA